MPEEETQTQNPQHLVVEKALFSRTTTVPEGTAEPAPQVTSEDDAVEQDAEDYSGAGGILARISQPNFFYIILVPMVLIEMILLYFVVKG